MERRGIGGGWKECEQGSDRLDIAREEFSAEQFLLSLLSCLSSSSSALLSSGGESSHTRKDGHELNITWFYNLPSPDSFLAAEQNSKERCVEIL